MYVVVMTYIWIGRSWIYLYILRYCSVACIYFSFRWGPFVHSLEIVQWDSTRRDHQGYLGRVSGSGPVIQSGTSDEGWAIHIEGSLRYRGRVAVPQLTYLREEILKEFHCSRFAVHPSGMKMYHDLHRQYY